MNCNISVWCTGYLTRDPQRGRDTRVENHCSDPRLFTPSLPPFSDKASPSPGLAGELTVSLLFTRSAHELASGPPTQPSLPSLARPLTRSHINRHTPAPAWPAFCPPTFEPHIFPKLLLQPLISMKATLPLLGPGCSQLESFNCTPSLPWPCLFSCYYSRVVIPSFSNQKALPSRGLGSQQALWKRELLLLWRISSGKGHSGC